MAEDGDGGSTSSVDDVVQVGEVNVDTRGGDGMVRFVG